MHNKSTNTQCKYSHNKVTLKPMIVAEILEADRIMVDRRKNWPLEADRIMVDRRKNWPFRKEWVACDTIPSSKSDFLPKKINLLWLLLELIICNM